MAIALELVLEAAELRKLGLEGDPFLGGKEDALAFFFGLEQEHKEPWVEIQDSP